jgi:hypothetical protein
VSSTHDLELPPDEPPTSGDWVDTDDVVAHPTEEELEQGRELGQTSEDDDGS